VWTLPPEPPPLVGAAVSVATARWCADWADGLITINQPVPTLREIVAAYRDAGGRGRLHLQVHLCWDPDPDRAEAIAHDQWRSNVFPPPACWDIDSAAVFDAVSEHVPPSAVHDPVVISHDLGRHAARLAEYAAIGFDEIALHHVGVSQDAFVDAFGAKVLPQLREHA
jgi:alkanesulfonate monooxygenase SsuD/methylene tetrahydromethanopterin reductase-like flavin-dependent oxidoreductase (luciferase family)